MKKIRCREEQRANAAQHDTRILAHCQRILQPRSEVRPYPTSNYPKKKVMPILCLQI